MAERILLYRAHTSNGSEYPGWPHVPQLFEPPDADPHVRWCGRGVAAISRYPLSRFVPHHKDVFSQPAFDLPRFPSGTHFLHRRRSSQPDEARQGMTGSHMKSAGRVRACRRKPGSRSRLFQSRHRALPPGRRRKRGSMPRVGSWSRTPDPIPRAGVSFLRERSSNS